jgi:hypothetical protein
MAAVNIGRAFNTKRVLSVFLSKNRRHDRSAKNRLQEQPEKIDHFASQKSSK